MGQESGVPPLKKGLHCFEWHGLLYPASAAVAISATPESQGDFRWSGDSDVLSIVVPTETECIAKGLPPDSLPLEYPKQ